MMRLCGKSRPSEAGHRHDFGLSLYAHCCVGCNILTFNRGCVKCSGRLCKTCFAKHACGNVLHLSIVALSGEPLVHLALVASTPVLELQRRVAEATGLPQHGQRLILDGAPLPAGSTLDAAGVVDGMQLTLVVLSRFRTLPPCAIEESDHLGLFKFLFIGDTCVGKSALLLAACHFTDSGDRWSYEHISIATIGVDLKICNVELDGRIAKLQVWDGVTEKITSKYYRVHTSYYRGAHGVIIVYDITDRESFKNVKHWVQEVDRYASDGVNLLLVGNKSDLSSKRAVQFDEGKELANSLGMQFFETSAKDICSVDNAVHALSMAVKDRILGGTGRSQT